MHERFFLLSLTDCLICKPDVIFPFPQWALVISILFPLMGNKVLTRVSLTKTNLIDHTFVSARLPRVCLQSVTVAQWIISS